MVQEKSISALRSRVSALVEQEAALLNEAFALSKAGGDRRGVDALFARVQTIQVERSNLKREIGNVIGTHRMHTASELWQPGVYDYRDTAGTSVVRVRVMQGPLGLQVLMPGRKEPVSIEPLEGSFDGPLAVDEAQAHASGPSTRINVMATAPGEAAKPAARRRKPRP